MNEDILCTHCSYWVRCIPNEKAKVKEPYGFCMVEDLFTYTFRDKCSAHNEGKPTEEHDWEISQRG